MITTIKQHIKITTKPEIIKEYIKERHLTHKQFAQVCGVSLSLITRILAGKTRFNTPKLQKVLSVVGISFEEFFDIELVKPKQL